MRDDEEEYRRHGAGRGAADGQGGGCASWRRAHGCSPAAATRLRGTRETSQDTSRGMTRSSPTRRRRPHGCGGGAGRTSYGTQRSQDEHPRVRAARVTHILACAPLGLTASRCRNVQRHSDAAPGRTAAPRGAAQRPQPAASRAHTQCELTHDLSSRNRILRKDCTCRAVDHGHDAADEGDAAAVATMTGEQR